MEVDKYLEDLETFMEGAEHVSEDERTALNVASDALAFCKVLFDAFRENGMLPSETRFNLSDMENMIDALTGELSAAVLYLKGQPPSRHTLEDLRKISTNLRDHNNRAPEEDQVPHVVQEGFNRLADRIESTTLESPIIR